MEVEREWQFACDSDIAGNKGVDPPVPRRIICAMISVSGVNPRVTSHLQQAQLSQRLAFSSYLHQSITGRPGVSIM